MKYHICKTLTVSICVGLFVFFIGQQQAQGQRKKALSLNEILVKLSFTSRINRSIEEINEQIILEVNNRRVNFVVTSKDEESLRKAGGNDLLIKVIRKNPPKSLKEKIDLLQEKQILYKKFTDNYNGTLEQKRTAIEAAKEYLRKYENEKEMDENDKQIIDYFRLNLPAFIEMINRKKNCDCP